MVMITRRGSTASGARWVVAVLVALVVALWAPCVWADPVDLLEQDAQVFVQDNGGVDVIYTLRFRDNEGRSAIRKIGELYEPLHFTRGLLRGEGWTAAVEMSSVGGGYYRADFERSTRAGQTYTLELHYRCNRRFADPTSRDGEELLAMWFNPVRWTLPVGRSVVKLVLPLGLPAGVEEHEDISPQMVDGLGVITDPSNLAEQDHWAFVFTDYRSIRRLTLYAERRSLGREETHLTRVYIPQAALPAVSENVDIEAGGGAAGERLVAEGDVTLTSEAYLLFTNMGVAEVMSDRDDPRWVEVSTTLTMVERGHRSFVPLPPVEVGLTPGRPTQCSVSLGGEDVGCVVRDGRVVFGRTSATGETVVVTVVQPFLRWLPYPYRDPDRASRSSTGQPTFRSSAPVCRRHTLPEIASTPPW